MGIKQNDEMRKWDKCAHLKTSSNNLFLFFLKRNCNKKALHESTRLANKSHKYGEYKFPKFMAATK